MCVQWMQGIATVTLGALSLLISARHRFFLSLSLLCPLLLLHRSLVAINLLWPLSSLFRWPNGAVYLYLYVFGVIECLITTTTTSDSADTG